MKILLDALQAENQSGTGTYVLKLLQNLPNKQASERPAALVRPSTPAAAWERFEIPRNPRITAIYRRHIGLGTVVDRVKPDIIHFPANFGSYFPIRAKTRPVIVTTLHDVTFMRAPSWFRADRAFFYRSMGRRTAAQSDLLIADSQSAANDIEQYLGFPRARIRVVPLGCLEPGPASVANEARLRARYGLPARFVLFLGTIEPRKNLPRLIQAWDRTAVETGCDLVIAGREGWKTGPYRAAVRAATHRDRIHQLGYVPDTDMAALIRMAAVFVWPSLYEGFGLPPLDAMACGTPVLTSATSSLPEVARDAAVFADPEQVESIAEGIRTLLRDETLRKQLVERGLARAAELTWPRTVDRTVEVYREALEMAR